MYQLKLAKVVCCAQLKKSEKCKLIKWPHLTTKQKILIEIN